MIWLDVFFFFRWNWSAYASIAKWQTIDLQQHIHDIFFLLSLRPSSSSIIRHFFDTFYLSKLFFSLYYGNLLQKKNWRILNCLPFSLHPNRLSRSSSFLEVLLLLFDIVQFGVVCVFLLFFFFFSLPLRSTQFYWETLKLFFFFEFFLHLI